jgi:hypothetical protein
MQWLSYYGVDRARDAATEAGFDYLGLVANTPWGPLTLAAAREVGAEGGSNLMQQLQGYAAVEAIGGASYHCHPKGRPLVGPSSTPPSGSASEEPREAAIFTVPVESGMLGWDREGDQQTETNEERLTAAETLQMVAEGGGAEPLCQWQMHLFRRRL